MLTQRRVEEWCFLQDVALGFFSLSQPDIGAIGGRNRRHCGHQLCLLAAEGSRRTHNVIHDVIATRSSHFCQSLLATRFSFPGMGPVLLHCFKSLESIKRRLPEDSRDSSPASLIICFREVFSSSLPSNHTVHRDDYTVDH